MLTTLDAAYLLLEVFHRIGQIVFTVILCGLIECLRDLVAHTRIDKRMKLLKRVSNCGAGKPKAPNRRLAEQRKNEHETGNRSPYPATLTSSHDSQPIIVGLLHSTPIPSPHTRLSLDERRKRLAAYRRQPSKESFAFIATG